MTGIIILALFLFVGLPIYCLPSIVAGWRCRANQNAIAALNILLGWTFIGWVIALVWAISDDGT